MSSHRRTRQPSFSPDGSGDPSKRRDQPDSERSPLAFRVVGMGASAGSLEAFQRFFEHMPTPNGMAFVLILHLDPHHSTLLPEILARHTRMTVSEAKDGTPLEPDHVYVIPPNATLTVEGGILRVRSLELPSGKRAPIDTFLRSLAEDQGDNTVCILLSGGGADGTLGLRAVKKRGGVAMVQTPETAVHDGLPSSAIATGLVDFILPAEQMPAILMGHMTDRKELHEETDPPPIWEDATRQLGEICDALLRNTGHDFRQYKQATLIRRVHRRLEVLQLPSVAAYVERLRDVEEAQHLLGDLLIGVTHFFRDPEAFDFIASKIVPLILDHAGKEGSIRVWTPGCATGEEPYSIAILLREGIIRHKTQPTVQIFAGDIDEEALDTARQGRYPEGIAAQVSHERLHRFFVKEGQSYRLGKEIREMVTFSTHNVLKDPPFSRLDLIVCRNLLIYLEPPAQKRIGQVFHYGLRQDGFLFLGPSENAIGHPELFRTMSKKFRIYRRNETIARAPLPFAVPELRPVSPFSIETRGGHAHPAPKPGSVQYLEHILVQHYSPAWVVIDSKSQAIYFSPRTGRYLEPPAGPSSTNLIEMARRSLRADLRTVIHQAFKTGQPAVREEIAVEVDGKVRKINLIVRPLSELGQESGFFMVVFQELTLSRSEEGSIAPTELSSDSTLLMQLESELRTTKEHLQLTIEELEAANEELTSSNEELLSTNEELQSSNEELQTSKEEIQSVNEELETINSELGTKVEELDTAHDDLQNLFASTRIATLFLDRDMHIKRFTPVSTRIFRLIETDAGRSIADIAPRISDKDLLDDIGKVARSGVSIERQVKLLDGSAVYMMRILPYWRSDAIDGVVLTFVDLSDLSRALTKQKELASIVESSEDAIVGCTVEEKITIWNASATRMFGYDPEEVIGAPIWILVPPEHRRALENIFGRFRSGEAVGHFESVNLTKSGERLHLSLTLSSVKDSDGRVVATAGIFRDLGELARTKEALKQEIQRKDEFLAMLSHELRNPLAPLRTGLDTLDNAHSSDDKIAKAKHIMSRQLVHLTTLVDQLLDISRIASGKILLYHRPLDLVDLLRTTLEDVQPGFESRGLRIEKALPEGPLWINGDAIRLGQSLGNVLNNALKFTDQGSVRVSLETPPAAGQAILVITDSGIGIAPDMRPRVFEPFSQADQGLARSRGGLGLGLALAKGLIESHGGTVEVRSEGIGKGSEFTIRLPLIPDYRPETKAALAPETSPDNVPSVKRRILVVEDNADAAESIKDMLEVAGHDVALALDGRAAIEEAHRRKPDVILCDIGLPGGLDGYDLAKIFRSDPNLASIRLVALTGYGLDQEQDRAYRAGFDLHMCKPADPDLLRRWISNS